MEREARESELRSGLSAYDIPEREEKASEAGLGKVALHTVGDLAGNVITGAVKGLEGIYDLGAGVVGAVGGIFDRDFRERVKEHVAYDFTSENIGNPLNELTEHSALNDSKVGGFIENVASGVGQMLPAVAVSLATAGIGTAAGLAAGTAAKAAQVASLGTLTASAAGSGTEEAFGEGADYGKGLAYGAATGAIEGLTEKMWGGLGGLTGKGVLDSIGKSVAKTGVARVAKEALQEGTEEAVASLASPALKSIYKGRDAFSEYGEGDYWRGVSESALVGAGTSVAYGGTVGRLQKTTGKYADVKEVLDEVEDLERERADLYAKDELESGDAQDTRIKSGIKANYELLSRVLKSASDTRRADLIKRNSLSDRFDADGSIRGEFLAELDESAARGQEQGQKENAAVAQNSAAQRRYMSPSLWGRRGKVEADLASLTEQRREIPGAEESPDIKVFEGELSDAGKAAHSDAKKVWNALSKKTGSRMQIAIVDGGAELRGARRGDVIYISKNALEDGGWTESVMEEAVHFTEGSREHFDLGKFLAGQTEIMDEVRAELTEEGNPYGFTEEDAKALNEGRSKEFGAELTAHAAAKILDNEAYINKLVRSDAGLAQKIKNRISDVVDALESMKDAGAREAYRLLKRTSELFDRALESGGQIVGGDDGEEEEGGSYSLASNAATELHKAIYDKNYRSEIRLKDETPSILLGQSGVRNLPMAMQVSHIRENVFNETEARNLGLRVDEHTHYHGLGEKFFLQIVDGLDHVTEAYRGTKNAENSARRENYFLLISKFTDKDGNEINVPVYINEHANHNNVMIDANKIATVFGRKGLREYIDREVKKKNLVRIKNKNTQTSEPNALIAKRYGMDVPNNSISQNSEKSTPRGNFSLKKVDDGANQQTSGDFDGVLKEAGIEEASEDLTSSLQDFRALATRRDAGELEVKRMADALAMYMVSEEGTLRDGETIEDATERVSEAMIASAGKKAAKRNAASGSPVQSAKAEHKRAEYWKAKQKATVERGKLLRAVGFAVENVANMKKGRYVNAGTPGNDTFSVAMKALAKMNWRGSLVRDSKIREHFSKLASWYSPKNALYGHDGKAGDRYRQDIKDALDTLADSSAGALTNDDLRLAEYVVKYFANEIKNYGTIYKNGKREDAIPGVKRYIKGIDEAAVIGKNSGILMGLFRSAFARMTADPAMLMREADGYLEGGFFSEQYEELRSGTIEAAVTEREIAEEFDGFFEKHKEYAKRYEGATVEYEGKKMPLQEAIALYMTMKREQAFAGIAYAGFEIEGEKATEDISGGFASEVEAIKVEIYNEMPPEDALTMTDEVREAVEADALARAVERRRDLLYEQFSKEDKALIEIMERGLDKCRDIKIEIDNILQGDSNVTGGYYFPIKRTGLAESVDTMSAFEGDRVSNLSINKDTVKNAHKLLIEPVHIVYMRHLKAISLYKGLGVFTDNFNRLYNLNIGDNINNPETIRTAIGRSSKFTAEMISYFKELKQDVEGISKKRSAEKFYNNAVAFIRSHYATYQLGANPKTWVTQFSSMIAATDVLDADSVVKGLSVSGKDVDKYCKLAWLRNNDSTAAMALSVSTNKNAVQRATGSVLQKIRDVSMLPIGKVDRLVITKLFGACQVQIEKDGGAKVGSEENKIAAGKLMERVILETQQNSLPTERTAAMRSGDELLKGASMFSADAMKVGARFIEPYAEISALRTQVRLANKSGEPAKIAALEAKISKARKKCVRATSVLVSVALFNALLAYGFKWLYRRDEEESVGTITADTFGNMIGGVPFVRDVYGFFTNGFEMENFAISTVNNLLETVEGTFTLVGDAVNGKEITQQQAAKAMRDVLYSAGQLAGVPTRNLYNNVTGIINRVAPGTGYWIDSHMYNKNYSADLSEAIEKGDERMVRMISGLIMNESVGDLDKATREVMRELTEAGYDVLPRSVGDTVTYEGESVQLTRAQKKRFSTVYEAADEAAADLVALETFKNSDAEVQAKALKFIYNTYYGLAVDDVLGVDSTKKNVLFAEAIEVEKLALIATQARALEADKDSRGNAIAGSRRRKVERYVAALKLSAAQKYMILGYLGYSNKNGRGVVERYINSLALSKEEKAALLEFSGYKN